MVRTGLSIIFLSMGKDMDDQSIRIDWIRSTDRAIQGF